MDNVQGVGCSSMTMGNQYQEGIYFVQVSNQYGDFQEQCYQVQKEEAQCAGNYQRSQQKSNNQSQWRKGTQRQPIRKIFTSNIVPQCSQSKQMKKKYKKVQTRDLIFKKKNISTWFITRTLIITRKT